MSDVWSCKFVGVTDLFVSLGSSGRSSIGRSSLSFILQLALQPLDLSRAGRQRLDCLHLRSRKCYEFLINYCSLPSAPSSILRKADLTCSASWDKKGRCV